MATRISKTSIGKVPGPTATRDARTRTPSRSAAKGAAKRNAPTVASQLPGVSVVETTAAKEKFEQGILARGEAVPAGQPLPAGATHEIVGKARDGAPILKRRRFSII
jgi:hypothetical protein